ncbi:MAG TPA: OmpW family outer membrane protein [Thermoanaerobaculia bacterium]|nr:OmpW family outer membrane protein [Thermoanaerobaculia bacterium]
MKKTSIAALVLVLALLALPAAAQVTTEIGFLGTWIHSTTTTVTNAQYDIGVKFQDGAGGGLFVDVRPWKLVSFELSGFYTRQSAAITANGSTLVSAGSLEAKTGVLEAKLHPLGDGTFDLYVGAGGAYAGFNDLTDSALDAAGIGTVTVKGKAGFAGSAGVRVKLGASAGFVVDAKYLALKPESQGASGPPTDLRWNPLLVSAGFGFRF